jgi:hypothetical protein
MCRSKPVDWKPGMPNAQAHATQPEEEENQEGFNFMVREVEEQEGTALGVRAPMHPLSHWGLDSGASWNMTPRADLLRDMKAPPFSHITAATRDREKVLGMGTVMFIGAEGQEEKVEKVLLVPDLKANPLSTRVLEEQGMQQVSNKRSQVATREGRVLWRLNAPQDIYKRMWHLQVQPWGATAAAATSPAGSEEDQVQEEESARSGGATLEQWHLRLGHVAVSSLKELLASGQVEGFKVEGPLEAGSCRSCMEGKFSKFPYPRVEGNSSCPLELVHGDLVGPMRTEGRGRYLYWMTLVDDFTRMKWVIPLQKKSDAAGVLMND